MCATGKAGKKVRCDTSHKGFVEDTLTLCRGRIDGDATPRTACTKPMSDRQSAFECSQGVFENKGVKSGIVFQLRMKAHTINGALPYGNRFSFEAGDDLYSVTAPNDSRCPYKHHRERRLCLKDLRRVRVVECGFKAMNLASPTISLHIDVKPTKRRLLRSADLRGRQDQARTGSKNRIAGLDETVESSGEVESVDKFEMGRAFATR